MTEETTGYDPDQDPDTDPGSLNPRTGGAASDEGDGAAGGDPDADPGNLNPRSTEEGTA
jgi:hypothetical protein